MSIDRSKDASVRWQSAAKEQLGYTINLILTFSVATLGFQLSFFQKKNFKIEFCSFVDLIFLLSLFCLVLSLGFGVWAVLNRLCDFRLTARIARQKKNLYKRFEIEEESKEIKIFLAPFRKKAKKIGKCTWSLFYLQIGTFSAGILLTIVSVLDFIYKKH